MLINFAALVLPRSKAMLIFFCFFFNIYSHNVVKTNLLLLFCFYAALPLYINNTTIVNLGIILRLAISIWNWYSFVNTGFFSYLNFIGWIFFQ
ncbi:hypothetical protein C2G38_2128571, partial [Gigaspora rosea]